MWGSSDTAYSKADERVQYKFINVYNETTNEIVKKKVEMKKSLDRILRFLEFLSLSIVLSAMVFYNIFSVQFKGQMNGKGEIVSPPNPD